MKLQTTHRRAGMPSRVFRRRQLCILLPAYLALATPALLGGAHAQEPGPTPLPAIEPMTNVNAATGVGYFSDPYPIRLAPWLQPFVPQFFSGTTKDLLGCDGQPTPGCFQQIPYTVTASDSLQQQAAAVGTTLTTTFENNNIYQDDTGQWQMATTLYVKNPAFPDYKSWTVILHAHSANPIYPTVWIADTVIAGSLEKPAKANYDGKYFVDGSQLYLIYSKRLSNNPAHDGIVAQRMDSPTQAADEDPTTLLQPEDANGGYNSEYFYIHHADNAFKLIETGNITEVDGKYVMAYSTGAYNERDYKTGLAWSDTLIPAAGTYYKKILKQDTADVWGQPDHKEVVYLLQAEKPAWPNYVAAEVLAPGVPSVVQDYNGSWYLYFAGYLPSDPHVTNGVFNSAYRRPYFVKLNVDIPAGASVSDTSNADLASWITTVSQ